MSPVASLDSEGGAGRAGLLAVALVAHWMVARVSSGADPRALRGSHSTGHRGVDDCRAAGTGQLLETDHGAPRTLAPVTELLAAVQRTAEQLAAEERTGVLHHDAALLAALVSAAGSLGLALLAAPGIVSPRGQLGAGQLAVHVATAAPHQGGERARQAESGVARQGAEMRRGGGTTGQRFLALFSACGDRV